LTECGDLSEVEAEEMESVVVAVKTAEAIEMVVVTITAVALTVKTAVVVVTDEKGDGRWHIRGNSGS
jgi:hypothetical protein